MHREWQRDGLTVSTDLSRLDVDASYGFLSTCDWVQGIARGVRERSMTHVAERAGGLDGEAGAEPPRLGRICTTCGRFSGSAT